MRPEDMQLALRPRSAWEAVELGLLLVRHHAGALWRPWLLLSLPVFAITNALGWWLGHVWLAGLLMWWLLPVFDRIPLYVLSRAAFGTPPGSGETLRAWPKVGPGYIATHLLWRRLGPWRAQCLPVDLLEDGNARNKARRRTLLLSGQRGVGALLTWLCQCFVLILTLSILMLVLLFVPTELLSQSIHALWSALSQHPLWAQLAWNTAWWLGLSLIEPFYIGAGFGLYLNRRVQLEGWEIELALRGLNARLGRGSKHPAAMLLTLCLLLPGAASPQVLPAQDETPPAQSLEAVFGDGQVADAQDFLHALDAARQDPLLNRQQTRHTWVPKTRQEPDAHSPSSSLSGRNQALRKLISGLAGAGEIAMWLLLAALALLLLFTAPRWWPWMRHAKRPRTRTPGSIRRTPEPVAEPPLPQALIAHARARWQAGEKRQALALLYRGGLASLSAQAGIGLSTATTEAQCLHLSAHLHTPEQHRAFAHLVHTWQHAAYARRWPDDAGFAALSGELAQHFRWRK